MVVHGVGTLILNVRYSSVNQGGREPQPELPDALVTWLNHWQGQALAQEEPEPTSLVFKDQALVVYPHSAWFAGRVEGCRMGRV